MVIERNRRLFDLHEESFPTQGIAEDQYNAMEDNHESDLLMINKLGGEKICQ